MCIRDSDRCMQSLEYELRRREDIFASVGAKDIKEYIKGHHKGEFQEAVPRLLIVFDEFKELIKERPVVKKMVDSIAAKGSSLGVHLILATQSPAAVSYTHLDVYKRQVVIHYKYQINS